MCGIIGFANSPDAGKMAKEGLVAMPNRGIDSKNILSVGKVTLGHSLHAVIDFVPQPIQSEKGVLVINCEIYNWKELAKKHGLDVKNDAELVLAMLSTAAENRYAQILKELDGDYALAYYSKKNNHLLLARDLAGVKPLVYYFSKETKVFAFASEKKALAVNNMPARHLNPRQGLIFDCRKNKVSYFERKIGSKKSKASPKAKELAKINQIFSGAVEKRIPKGKFALLLSGGLDSALIASRLNNSKADFECFFSCISDPQISSAPADEAFAKKVSESLGKKLHIAKVTLGMLEEALPKIIQLIESTDPIRVGVASTLYFATKNISGQKIRVVFTGLGADELFAGYDRFKNSTNINKDTYSYFIKLYENDLYYQDIICMQNNLELRVPFLDEALTDYALTLPAKYKIKKSGSQAVGKIILRELAKEYGVEDEIFNRKKKAAQYGSNFDKALELIAKKNHFKSKAEYLKKIGKAVLAKALSTGTPIGALISTGKDSIYAMHLMQKQGYFIKCLITVDSTNKDSFMFHTPTIALAKLQAKALGLPLILVKTRGEKEKELEDLKKAVLLAKNKFEIDGLVCGALYSNYQRERIEAICESAGLRAFTPLWQINQINYLKQLVNAGFSAVITKIACYGLSEEWLGRTINAQAIAELEALEKKFKINPAGEGGEYETLMLDAPIFKKKLSIEFKKKMENEFTGEITIKKARLVEK